MMRQSERKHKAVPMSIPEAATMRTIIATALAVCTATVLITVSKPAQVTVHNFDSIAISEQVSAQSATAETKPTDTKPADAPATIQAAPAQKAVETTQAVPVATCASEIGKYSSWSQNAAYNVMMQESRNDPNILNDNPMTGDYSVGCFQINLINANLNDKYRVATTLGYTGGLAIEPMVAWLKDPVNNVAMANALYNRAGNWGDWKITCTIVQCY
jgi:hypothetical protein